VTASDVSLPPLACETHSHVYGDQQPYPLHAGHAVPGGSLENYRKVCRSLGVERHVLVQAMAYATDTRWLLRAIAETGLSRARGVICPDDSLSADDLAELHRQGIRGVRFLSGPGAAVDTPAILATARRIAPLRWSVLVQAPAVALAEAYDALACAECPVVIDHMARVPPGMDVHDDVFQALLQFLRGGGWIKISAPYYGTDDGRADFGALRARLDGLLDTARDRAIWGMNWPHPSLAADRKPDEAATLRSLLAIMPDAATRQALFANNPARLYGFG